MKIKNEIKKHPLVFKILKSVKNILVFFRDKYKNMLYLTNYGERVDIKFNKKIDFNKFEINEKCHYLRYKYAEEIIPPNSVIGDFACGTGYGSIILAQNAEKVVGIDIDNKTIESIKKRYGSIKNIEFISKNILDLNFINTFDFIVSFETIEHLTEEEISRLFKLYNNALKEGGILIFSTPYMQEKDEGALKAGFHKTFDIGEEKIKNWMKNSNFEIKDFSYQSYENPVIKKSLEDKQFVICLAKKLTKII
jgi:2-polyprenyl-3-methyl-5-hydroxy-6-metoxy-1,4-benzoquinol methylase